MRLAYIHRHTLIHLFFFFNDTATTEIYTLSLHDALPISHRGPVVERERLELRARRPPGGLVERQRDDVADRDARVDERSEEHTSELQSRQYLVCRLLLEKKKKQFIQHQRRTDSYTYTIYC